MKTNIKFCITTSLFKILEYKNINDITISEIVKNAKIARSSFYNNFGNITDAVNYKLNNIVDDIYRIYKLNKIRGNNFSDFLILLLDFIEKNKVEFILIKSKLFNDFNLILDNKFVLENNNLPRYAFISGAIFNLLNYYLDKKINKNQIIDFIKQKNFI